MPSSTIPFPIPLFGENQEQDSFVPRDLFPVLFGQFRESQNRLVLVNGIGEQSR
jgi:hypothetical protein